MGAGVGAGCCSPRRGHNIRDTRNWSGSGGHLWFPSRPPPMTDTRPWCGSPPPHRNGNQSQQPAMVNLFPVCKPATPPHCPCCRMTKRNQCRWCITPVVLEPKPRNTPQSSPVNSAVNTKPCPTSQWTNISKDAASTTPKNAHQSHQQSKQTEATLRRRSLTGLWMSTDLIDPMLKRRLLRRCRLWWHCMKLISLSEAATNSPPARCLGQRAGQLLPLAVNTKQDLPALAK